MRSSQNPPVASSGAQRGGSSLDRLFDAAALMAALCAVVITAFAIRDRWLRSRAGSRAAPVEATIPNWKAYGAVGHSVGDRSAPVTIVVFSDYQCPYCRRFAGTMRAVEASHPSDVRFVVRQWPLPNHPLAYPAARASECSADQGRFAEYHDQLFTKQDSLGIIPFAEFAKRAGVPDQAAFEACVSNAKPVPLIERDIADAQKLGGRGTPTILVNDIRLADTPDSSRLEALVKRALSNR